MKKTMKTLSLCLLSISMLVTSSFAAVTYKDVPEKAWYKGHLEYLEQNRKDLLPTSKDGNFKPTAEISVGEFVTTMVKLMNEQPSRSAKAKENPSVPYIEKATQLGFVKAKKFTAKDYTRSITRGEALEIAVKVVEKMYADAGETHKFRLAKDIRVTMNDFDMAPVELKPSLMRSVDYGIALPNSKNCIAYKDKMNRSQMADLLHRILDKSARNNIETHPCYIKKAYLADGIWFNPDEFINPNDNLVDQPIPELQKEIIINTMKKVKFIKGKKGQPDRITGYIPQGFEKFRVMVSAYGQYNAGHPKNKLTRIARYTELFGPRDTELSKEPQGCSFDYVFEEKFSACEDVGVQLAIVRFIKDHGNAEEWNYTNYGALLLYPSMKLEIYGEDGLEEVIDLSKNK